jgi:hypothetical protein
MSVIDDIIAVFPLEADQKKVIALLTRDNALELNKVRYGIERKVDVKDRITEMANDEARSFTTEQKDAIISSAALTTEETNLKDLLDGND